MEAYMLLFLCSVGLLILGYVVYGAFVEKIFGPDPGRPMPAVTMADGVDYVEMSTPKLYLIQILNIAGLGPIFGPILGALYGPSALLWVVFGCIFAGAVHDYFVGMISIRYNGESIPNIVGRTMGNVPKQIMNYFSVLLLLLVGVVFVLGPAALLSKLLGLPVWVWVTVIFAYYFLATMLPIDKIIGNLYPVFGALLLFMTVSLTVMLFASNHPILPQGLDLANSHPKELPIWPLMFITIACGAISGFHATQSPIVSRCLTNESKGRLVFYGAMIGEGIIGLIWVTLGLSFYENTAALNAAINAGTPSGVVYEVCNGLLGGGIGTILAVLGVVVLPITSGDTAFRSARLIIAEYFKIPQGPIDKRLWIAVPLFAVGIVVSFGDFNVIWRYFGWANQTLAAMALWSAAVYLVRQDKLHWICTVPATFMTAVTVAYICAEKMGFGLDYTLSNVIGIAAAAAALGAFLYLTHKPIATAHPAE
jgi:carbon starvation protein CstA